MSKMVNNFRGKKSKVRRKSLSDNDRKAQLERIKRSEERQRDASLYARVKSLKENLNSRDK